ncbi:transporter [Vibrio lentus]|nr:transporter [Vibrio lentus]
MTRFILSGVCVICSGKYMLPFCTKERFMRAIYSPITFISYYPSSGKLADSPTKAELARWYRKSQNINTATAGRAISPLVGVWAIRKQKRLLITEKNGEFATADSLVNG